MLGTNNITLKYKQMQTCLAYFGKCALARATSVAFGLNNFLTLNGGNLCFANT
jgi:hypothetical protein